MRIRGPLRVVTAISASRSGALRLHHADRAMSTESPVGRARAALVKGPFLLAMLELQSSLETGECALETGGLPGCGHSVCVCVCVCMCLLCLCMFFLCEVCVNMCVTCVVRVWPCA